MPLPDKYSPIDIKPLTGYFDVRSSPDSVKSGTWRYRQNLHVTDSQGNCRRPGWTKLFDQLEYNNEDLHDQLLELQEYYTDRAFPYTPQSDIVTYPPADTSTERARCNVNKQVRTTPRQPINFLFSAGATSGERKLLAGTQNRLYALNQSKGNWKIIADAYGGEPNLSGTSERRWNAAQVEDIVLFANGFDPVLAWVFDQSTFGCAMQAVTEIESLKGVGVSTAGVVASWKGLAIIGDVTVDGTKEEDRVQWSQPLSPLDWTPVTSDSNGAGFQNLGSGQRILAMKPLGDVLLIYTTKAIWQARFVDVPKMLEFQLLYSEPENGAACLAYPFTLVSNGQEHIYLGRDGVYVFNLFLPQPERVEWMHAASGEIFDTIDSNRCDSHSAWFDPNTKEYWVSWVEVGQNFPSRTLVFNTRYHTDDIVDHGFTAFCTYQADNRPTLLQWLQDNLICLRSEIAAMTDLITPNVKEGGYCLTEPVIDCTSAQANVLTGNASDILTGQNGETLTGESNNSELAICQNRNLPIWTDTPKDIDGRLIEDYEASGDLESLCTHLTDVDLDDICHECESIGTFIMASADDWCLKQYGGVYYRERCTDFSACGVYERLPYKTIMRSGALDFGLSREWKNVRSINLEYQAEEQAIPSVVEMRLGTSAQAVNSNNGNSGRCALTWHPLKPKNLECLSDRAGADHIAANTRPNKTMNWVFFFSGNYIYVELVVDGINGACCFSRLSLEVRQRPRSVHA